MSSETLHAIEAMFAGTPPRVLMRDALVLCHLAALAAGLGMVIATDLWVLRRMSAPFGLRRLAGLCRTHRLIARALGVLWVSGLGLAALALSAPGAEASPKLAAKFVVVSGLTVTAIVIRRIALPLTARGHGRPLLALPLGTKCLLAVCAGLSTAGWGSALLLGGAGVMARAEAPALIAVIGAVHAGMVVVMLSLALLTHERADRRTPAGRVPAQ